MILTIYIILQLHHTKIKILGKKYGKVFRNLALQYLIVRVHFCYHSVAICCQMHHIIITNLSCTSNFNLKITFTPIFLYVCYVLLFLETAVIQITSGEFRWESEDRPTLKK